MSITRWLRASAPPGPRLPCWPTLLRARRKPGKRVDVVTQSTRSSCSRVLNSSLPAGSENGPRRGQGPFAGTEEASSGTATVMAQESRVTSEITSSMNAGLGASGESSTTTEMMPIWSPRMG